ncbi:hypothetical protein JOQ06_006310, partial [Pogonophryne albipinna]
MKDTEIEVLKSDTSEWIKSISGDIVRSIIEEVSLEMTNQAGSHSDRVEQALNAPELLTPTDTVAADSSAEFGKETSPKVERIKMLVKVLVMKLVSRMYNKSKENSSLGDPKAVAENLFEKWDGAKRVLVIVNEGEQLADDVVASIFKYHLTNQPKKRGAVG